MKNILVPVDFSETSLNALEQALILAKAHDGQITLLNIVKKAAFPSLFSSTPQPGIGNEEAESKMNTLLEQYKDKGVKISYDIRDGKPYKAIADYAKENDVNLICMGTHGISGFEEFWVGSNTYKTVSVAPCPVISIRKGINPVPFSRIVLPIDNSKHTRQKVPFTSRLAAKFNASIHVVGITSDKSGDIYRKINNYVLQASQYIEDAGINCRTEMLQGSNITKTALQYAQRVEADLISIMTEQEVDPANLFLGPYAQQMVNHSEIPVLTSRPDEKLMGNVHAGY